MLHKNLPDGQRGLALLRRRLLDTIAWARYVATLKFKFASAIFRAHRDFAKMRKNYTTHPKINLLAVGDYSRINILVSYYLLRRRRFSDLKFKK